MTNYISLPWSERGSNFIGGAWETTLLNCPNFKWKTFPFLNAYSYSKDITVILLRHKPSSDSTQPLYDSIQQLNDITYNVTTTAYKQLHDINQWHHTTILWPHTATLWHHTNIAVWVKAESVATGVISDWTSLSQLPCGGGNLQRSKVTYGIDSKGVLITSLHSRVEDRWMEGRWRACCRINSFSWIQVETDGWIDGWRVRDRARTSVVEVPLARLV